MQFCEKLRDLRAKRERTSSPRLPPLSSSFSPEPALAVYVRPSPAHRPTLPLLSATSTSSTNPQPSPMQRQPAPELRAAWRVYTQSHGDAPLLSQRPDRPAADAALAVLNAAGKSRAASLWTLRYYEHSLSRELPALLASPSMHVVDAVNAAHARFVAAQEALAALDGALPEKERRDLPRRLRVELRAMLQAAPPPALANAVYEALAAHLLACEASSASVAGEWKGDWRGKEGGEGGEADGEQRQILENDANARGERHDGKRDLAVKTKAEGAANTPRVCVQLAEMGLSRIGEDALRWAVFERMEALVAAHTKPEKRALPGLLCWVTHFAAPFVASLLAPDSVGKEGVCDNPDGGVIDAPTATAEAVAARWQKRLVFHLHESVCGIRTRELLSLIAEFPDSKPALLDLRDCFLTTDRKPVAATCLRDNFSAALLNAGTQTADIVQRYVGTIRALRFLDSSGAILDCVSAPIRAYLRRRPDTVRCIVAGMTGDGDLFEELQRGRVRGVGGGGGGGSVDFADRRAMSGAPGGPAGGSAVGATGEIEDDDCTSIDGDFDANMELNTKDYLSWVPEPIDAPVREGRWHANGDAIATLVTIYGTSEQIVSEYRALLADKLVCAFDVDLGREERILQLLTDRFGKDAMHDCFIMLKDVRESRAALEKAREEAKEVSLDGFEATIISKEFWPRLVEEGAFKGIEEMERQMKVVSESFQKHNAPRTLKWQHVVGAVEVKVEFDNGREAVTTVSPMQATILWHFSRRRRMSVQALRDEMGVTELGVVQRKVQGLVTMGLLRAVSGGASGEYETVEEGAGVDAVPDDELVDGEGGGDDGEGADDDEGMAVYEKYVLAMVQNLKQLPLEQVHNMLQRFVQTPAYDKTQAQLASFLARLVDAGKLEVVAGMYRLKKPATS